MKILQVGLWVVLLLITLQSLSAQEMTPEVTAGTDVATPQPTATLGGVPLRFITGQVTYQNRLPDNAGIAIQILDNDLNLLGTAESNAQGVYTVTAPINAFYWLVAAAPLHQRQTLPVQPGATVPPLELMGGDLNQDGCIGRSDVQWLVSQLDLVGATDTDISGDGVTDVADLAIVTGNYDPNCEAPPMEATAEATAELTPEATEEATAETTPEVTVEVTAEITAEATAELTPEATEEATVETTPEVTAEVTAEITAEATAELTPEATEEATVETTPEVTAAPEATLELTVEPTTAEVTPEITVEPTATSTVTSTVTSTATPTSTPEVTVEVTPVPTQTPSPSVTFTPSVTETGETTVEPSAGD